MGIVKKMTMKKRMKTKIFRKQTKGSNSKNKEKVVKLKKGKGLRSRGRKLMARGEIEDSNSSYFGSDDDLLKNLSLRSKFSQVNKPKLYFEKRGKST